ncbi:MAG: endonuclease/exonuclease/phosphatase family protein [Bacteroidetes bacterium]|jgi:endonuclease/exonuclease/phosphatase family metal-dependent hydrolase|nr:endonuclease/exonuclease/phosphatase family protein [Bacteroidota bacterium]MDA1019565.1 endonuclease/exonuclease/phosphatase family protein [Bacteroidota bacterium]
MNNILYIFLIFLLNNTQNIKVISYNIRYNNPNDKVNIWSNRKSTVIEFISNENADFVGMQEVLSSQLIDLMNLLPRYNYIGVGRDDGKIRGEYSPILFNNNKYEVLESDTFWLSETPNEISVGWDASMERICTYGLFKNLNSNKKIWIFNTHFDHVGTLAREKSVELIIDKINKLNEMNYPVLLTGDFNLEDENKSIKKLQNEFIDSKKDILKSNHFYGTYNGFNNVKSNKRIDYVFFKNLILINSKHVYIKTKAENWASDHHPVVAYLKRINEND